MKNLSTYLIVFLLLVFTACKTEKELADGRLQKERKEVSSERKQQNALFFADGVRERITGNHDKAMELFDKAREADPNDHATLYELAELHANKGNIDKSLELMKEAIALNPENRWYWVRIAQIYKYIGDYEAYADVFYTLTEMDPGNPEYFGELSSALVLLEKYEEALEVFDKLETRLGVNELLVMQKHSIYLEMGKADKAIEEIIKLTKAFPYESRYYAMLAELYMKHGPRRKALETYEQIKQIDPGDPYIHIAISEYYLEEGDFERAFEELLLAFENKRLDEDTKIQILIFWLRGSEEQAEELERKTRALVEALVTTHPESARAHHMMAEIYYRQDEFELARDYFDTSISIDSNEFMVWENMLFVLIQLQDFDALQNYGKRTSRLFPEQPLPYYFTAVAKYQLEQYPEALKIAETGKRFVVKNDRLMTEFYTLIGDLNNQLGNNEVSDEAYETVLYINPAHTTALNNYAYNLSLRGENLDKAEEMSRKAVERSPEVAAYLDTYAWVLYKKGRYDEALVWIKKAVAQLENGDGVVLEHYGDILYKLNRKSEAMQYWLKADEAGGASELLQQKIADGTLYE